MMDFYVGCNICPKIYGEYISFQLRKATWSSTLTLDNVNDDQIMADPQRLLTEATKTLVPGPSWGLPARIIFPWMICSTKA